MPTCHHCGSDRLREMSRKHDWKRRRSSKGRVYYTEINYVCLDCWRRVTLTTET